MLLTLSGITTLAREEQALKAEAPILVTLSGITMLAILEQPANA